MQITSAKDNSLSEISIHSIGISIAKTTFLLRCPHCGREQMQVSGKPTRIIPWFEPTTTLITIHKCSRCMLKFTIQETQSRPHVLVRLDTFSPFFCIVCSHGFPNFTNADCPICKTIYDFKQTT